MIYTDELLCKIIDLLEDIKKKQDEQLEQGKFFVDRVKNMEANSFQKEEKELRNLMKDPRYWKHQDPEIVKRVEEGFKRLYG